MGTRIRVKRSFVPGKIPTNSDLLTAELAYNVPDGILYAKRERSGIGTDIVNVGAGASTPNLLYVAKNGNDNNTGRRLGDAKLSLESAVAISTTGTVIKILPGTYTVNNPLSLPPGVSIVGQDAKEVILQPGISTANFIYLNDNSLISNLTTKGTLDRYSVFSFNPSGITTIEDPPNIKNCYNYTNNSIGLFVDGSKINGPLKGVFANDFQQYNTSGIGISVTNEGYVQAKLLYSFCNDKSVYVTNGGVCSLLEGNTTFGNYGLYADGVSSSIRSGLAVTDYTENSDTFAISGVTTSPNKGDVVYFNNLYYTIISISIINGGSGYSRRPNVTISSPSTTWGINATAVANLSGDSVSSIDIVSNGRGYTSTPTIVISAPDSGINTATASVNISPKYYSIQSTTKTVSGISTLTINETLPYSVNSGSYIYYTKQSRIVAPNHTFEYVGTGTDKSTAYPGLGGIPIQENEIVTENGGVVLYSSIDQNGNYRIGDNFLIDQSTGSITGTTYTRSLFNNVTPLVLALGGE